MEPPRGRSGDTWFEQTPHLRGSLRVRGCQGWVTPSGVALMALPAPGQAVWPSGTECIAKYNFHGTAEQDLPFSKGDVLTIVAVTKVRCPLI